MSRARMEAFSDGVIAILITIMVLNLHVPQGSDWAAIKPALPILFAYLVSFVILGIYWNNHHHMLSAIHQVSGEALWANLHLLFWLSLIPFVTNWVDESNFASVPMAAYGIVLFLAAVAYYILVRVLVHIEGQHSKFAERIGRDDKGKVSLVIYAISIPVAFLQPLVSFGLYIAVAIIWFIPDRRFEEHRH